MINSKQDIKYIQILPAPTENAMKNFGIDEIHSM